MSNECTRSEADAIQDGVIAAVMRVAAVSAPGTRELVIEFDAACRAIRCRTLSGRLERIFCEGLAVDRFKYLVRDGIHGQPLSAALRRGIALLEHDEGDVAAYRRLVLEAADAAARAETAPRARMQPTRYLERMAIRDIESAIACVTHMS